MRTYASSQVKGKSFYRKTELQMFVLISGGHIGGQKLSTNDQSMAAGNQQKHLEVTFSIKALCFHSRAGISAHKHVF